VPSIGGRSHCPTEDTEPRHLVHGCAVLARFLVEFAGAA
jgi:acetylornithine deacetylase/succinyl-diaminopimelate desuccinylase-like protein